jgi:hypothetical protein
MKNKTTTLHDGQEFNNCSVAGNGAMGQQWKLGLDVDLRNIAVAIQCGRGLIGPARKFTREQLIAWVKQKRAQGHTVYAVSECCGFGYTLHEQLVSAGAHSLISTSMRLNLERRRKNDRMDARELCVRLSRYLDGHRDELKAIRIPSRRERESGGNWGGNGSFGNARCAGWKIMGARCAWSMSTRHWRRAGLGRANGRGSRRSAASLCAFNLNRLPKRSGRPRRNWMV